MPRSPAARQNLARRREHQYGGGGMDGDNFSRQSAIGRYQDVIPAKAGTQAAPGAAESWIPACAGMTPKVWQRMRGKHPRRPLVMDTLTRTRAVPGSGPGQTPSRGDGVPTTF